MATNNSNVDIRNISAITIVPYATTVTGVSVSSVDKVVTGTGTLFTTEVKVGDILWSTTDEWREVISITSDTVLVLDSAFTVALVGTSPAFVKSNMKNPPEISMISSNDWLLTTKDTATITAGLPVNLTKIMRDRSASNDLISPCIVDPNGGSVIVSIIR